MKQSILFVTISISLLSLTSCSTTTHNFEDNIYYAVKEIVNYNEETHIQKRIPSIYTFDINATQIQNDETIDLYWACAIRFSKETLYYYGLKLDEETSKLKVENYKTLDVYVFDNTLVPKYTEGGHAFLEDEYAINIDTNKMVILQRYSTNTVKSTLFVTNNYAKSNGYNINNLK